MLRSTPVTLVVGGLSLVVASFALFGTPLTADATLEQRRHQIEAMTPAQRSQLAKRRERFDQYPAEEQQRLRELARQIDEAPDAAELEGVLNHYYSWMTKLEPGQRAELASLDSDARLDAVRRIRQRQELQKATQLSEEDLRALSDWLVDHVMSSFPPRQRRLFEPRLSQMSWQERTVLAMLRGWKMIERSPILNEASVGELAKRLSPPSRRRLESTTNVKAQRQLVFSWVRQLNTAAQDHFRGRLADIDEEELATFFHDLPVAERDELMALPPDEMLRELRMRYMRDHGPNAFGRLSPFGGPGTGAAGRRNSPLTPRYDLGHGVPRSDAARPGSSND